MNLESPRCVRCEGTRFLHSQRVVDANTVTREQPWIEWSLRPVGAWDSGEPVGRFETLTCRACGLTAWYAREWAGLLGVPEQRACLECALETDHTRLPAVEHGEGKLERAPLVHEDGPRGLLFVSICGRCDRVTWTARQLEGLARVTLGAREGRCLTCNGKDSIVADPARERGGVNIPIALETHRSVFGLRIGVRCIGELRVRACSACRVLEWCAKKPEKLQPMPREGLHAIDGLAHVKAAGGPYR